MNSPSLFAGVLLNVQGVNPGTRSASAWKLPFIKDILRDFREKNIDLQFLALTESWLKPCVFDAQINLIGFNAYRADRVDRDRGGTILYINEGIPIDSHETYDDDTCSAVACYSGACNTIFSCIYRPPSAPPNSFRSLLNFIRTFIHRIDSSMHSRIVMVGDFNLPNISWSDNTFKKIDVNTNSSCEMFLSFMETHFLSQYINENTRGSNILDLFLTNDPSLFQLNKSQKTILSDHNLVTAFFSNPLIKPKNLNSCSGADNVESFRSLNFSFINYDKVNEKLSSLDWTQIFDSCDFEDFPKRLNEIVLSVCKMFCTKEKTKKILF